MDRKKSVTTRIHQPPAPPCWFRTVFYLSFGAWVLLQAATEYYTTRCLHIYTHLPIFEKEKQVTAAFLNIVSVGILTVFLVLSFIYGICTVSKLIVLSSSAFLSTLLILNILAVGILMSSHFGLDLGPLARNKRVLTIYHKNVSKEYWRGEIRAWAAYYPLPAGGGSTTAGPSAPSLPSTAGPTGTPSPRANGDPTPQPATDDTAPAASGNGTDTTGGPSTGAPAVDDLGRRSAWVESRALHQLRFFQHRAFCCGIEGPADYELLNAQTPPSCVCRDEGHQYGQHVRPPCTARAHTLANGTVSAVWRTGCLQVKRELMDGLVSLRDMLAATVALQAAVMALGLVLGLNMPSSLSDDSDDEGGDY
ncbi:uncharacterized protein LOC122376955 [Amphibalanus amphitrite]|uniref:uncharacterized protein LOC122376955 n=1 Tax=Amphibalanus amphitrite TaxID=1232801 RepID=UPI001C92A8AE|nr:uncharacterized protein LOC122376955 [Amphibalanus amphitrite]